MGNFYRHSAIFFWSHWSECTRLFLSRLRPFNPFLTILKLLQSFLKKQSHFSWSHYTMNNFNQNAGRATIAQWINLSIPFSSPWFESRTLRLCSAFFEIVEELVKIFKTIFGGFLSIIISFSFIYLFWLYSIFTRVAAATNFDWNLFHTFRKK